MNGHEPSRRSVVTVVALCAAVAVAGLWAGASGTGAQSAEQLYLTVLDDDGQPVTDLRPYEVQVSEDGVRREVLYLSRAGGPADITLLVDTSGAMVPATTHLRPALNAFVDALNGHARMSLITFGDLPVRVVNPTTTLTRMREAIDDLFPTEGAAPRFQDALMSAAIDLRDRQPARPAIVVLASDQLADTFAEVSLNSTARSVDDVIGVMQALGAPVHIIALRSRESFDVITRGASDRNSVFRSPLDNALRTGVSAQQTRDWLELFETVSDRTGGRLTNLYASSGLDEPLLDLANEILGQYILTYHSPPSDAVTDEREIGIGVARDDVSVRVTLVR